MASDPNSIDPVAAMGAMMNPTRALEGWAQLMGQAAPQNGGGGAQVGLGGAPLDPTAAMIGGLEMWQAAVNTQFNVAISMLQVMGGSRR